MKILDLLEGPIVPEVSPDKKYSGRFINKQSRPDGSGGSSVVAPHKTDPHLMTKHNHRPIQDGNKYQRDGFSFFINYIIDNGMTDNVHFPRIYSMKKIIDKNGKYIHKYDTEKLLHSHQINRKEFAKIFQELTNKEADERYESVENQLIGLIVDAIHAGVYTELKSKDIVEACKLLTNCTSDAIKAGYAGLDIFSNNIMYRRTPIGVQLVINDPIA